MDNKEQISKQIEEIKREFNQKIKTLENQLYSGNKQIGWGRVNEGEVFYYINRLNEIRDTIEDSVNLNNDKLYDNANYFTTKEKAEEIDFKQTLFRKLQRFADENNEEKIDWNNSEQPKYSIGYDCYNEEIYVIKVLRDFGQVHFISKEIAEKAIETFKDDLEKYFEIN